VILAGYAFVTGRPEKALEAGRMGFALERIDLDLPEPQSLDPSEVAETKVRTAFDRVHRPVVVEDSGLEILAWGAFPGALIRWLEKSAGLEAIPRMLDAFPDRRARAVCAIACFDGTRVIGARGVTEGSIAPAPRGSLGFGWDSIFVPEGSALTYAEMPADAKDRVSHRGRAWRSLADKIRSGR
jgi:non-canonical purine NTP pyrophosphatase (RdgB/HAM1 family)